jgi:acyl carrier protein
MDDINKKVRQCFENLGIIIDNNEDNFVLSDYITDSRMFISLLVELEQMLNINIPDDFLVQDRLVTYQDLCNMIASLI